MVSEATHKSRSPNFRKGPARETSEDSAQLPNKSKSPYRGQHSRSGSGQHRHRHQQKGSTDYMSCSSPSISELDRKVAITIQSSRADFDEKAEVLVQLNNPDVVVEKMLRTLANRFPPESVLTIQTRDGIADIAEESAGGKGGSMGYMMSAPADGRDSSEASTSRRGATDEERGDSTDRRGAGGASMSSRSDSQDDDDASNTADELSAGGTSPDSPPTYDMQDTTSDMGGRDESEPSKRRKSPGDGSRPKNDRGYYKVPLDNRGKGRSDSRGDKEHRSHSRKPKGGYGSALTSESSFEDGGSRPKGDRGYYKVPLAGKEKGQSGHYKSPTGKQDKQGRYHGGQGRSPPGGKLSGKDGSPPRRGLSPPSRYAGGKGDRDHDKGQGRTGEKHGYPAKKHRKASSLSRGTSSSSNWESGTSRSSNVEKPTGRYGDSSMRESSSYSTPRRHPHGSKGRHSDGRHGDGGRADPRLHGHGGHGRPDGRGGGLDGRHGGTRSDPLIHGGHGRHGDPRVHGGHGDPRVHGGHGDPRVHGGHGDPRVHGGHGDPLMHGGHGDPLMHGGHGDPRVHGRPGDSRGHAGSDPLVHGGRGRHGGHGYPQTGVSMDKGSPAEFQRLYPALSEAIEAGEEYYTEDENGEKIHVRVVEVPVVEEVIRQVPRKETIEIEKRVPKYEYTWTEKVVEVPQVEYIEKFVEVPEMREVVKHIPRHEVREIPREVIKYVPKVIPQIVEQVVHVPRIVEVPKPYMVEKRMPSGQMSGSPTQVETVVAQVVKPVLVEDENDVDNVQLKKYEPKIVTVDVWIPVPVESKLKPMGNTGQEINRVNVPVAQYNTLTHALNPYLGTPDVVRGPPYKQDPTGNFPMLPPSERLDIVTPETLRGGGGGGPRGQPGHRYAPDGRPLFEGETFGQDGTLLGPDGRPVMGPDYRPLAGRVLHPGERIGPDGSIIGADGRPVMGPDGLPVSPGDRFLPDGRRAGIAGGFGPGQQHPGGFGPGQQHPGGFGPGQQHPGGFGPGQQYPGGFGPGGSMHGGRNVAPDGSMMGTPGQRFGSDGRPLGPAGGMTGGFGYPTDIPVSDSRYASGRLPAYSDPFSHDGRQLNGGGTFRPESGRITTARPGASQDRSRGYLGSAQGNAARRLSSPDGHPIDGRQLRPGEKIGPDGKIIGMDGRPVYGPDGYPVGPGDRFGMDGRRLAPNERYSPEGKTIGPDGRPVQGRRLLPGESVGPDGELIGADGRPIMGPDGRPISTLDTFGPDGTRLLPGELFGLDGRLIVPDAKRLSPGEKIGPDGNILGRDGRPLCGPDGRPLSSGDRFSPDGVRLGVGDTLGRDGRIYDADGHPVEGQRLGFGESISPDGNIIGADGRPVIGPDGRALSPTDRFTPDGKRLTPSDNLKFSLDGRPVTPRAEPRADYGSSPYRASDDKTSRYGARQPTLDSPYSRRHITGDTIGPEGRQVQRGERVGSDGNIIGADGRPIIGPDGYPVAPHDRFGPDGRRLGAGEHFGPDGRVFGADGRPCGGRRLAPGETIGPDGTIVGPDGRPVIGPDGRPVAPGDVYGPDGRRLGPGEVFGPDGRVIGPANRRLSPGEKVGRDGRILGADGRPVIGPDGRRIAPGDKFSPDGKRLPGRYATDGRMPPGRQMTSGDPRYGTHQHDEDDSYLGSDGLPIEDPDSRMRRTLSEDRYSRDTGPHDRRDPRYGSRRPRGAFGGQGKRRPSYHGVLPDAVSPYQKHFGHSEPLKRCHDAALESSHNDYLSSLDTTGRPGVGRRSGDPRKRQGVRPTARGVGRRRTSPQDRGARDPSYDRPDLDDGRRTDRHDHPHRHLSTYRPRKHDSYAPRYLDDHDGVKRGRAPRATGDAARPKHHSFAPWRAAEDGDSVTTSDDQSIDRKRSPKRYARRHGGREPSKKGRTTFLSDTSSNEITTSDAYDGVTISDASTDDTAKHDKKHYKKKRTRSPLKSKTKAKRGKSKGRGRGGPKMSTKMMPTGMMPTGMMPTGMMPAGMMPTGMMPTGMMPTGMMPTGMMPTGMMPTGMMADGTMQPMGTGMMMPDGTMQPGMMGTGMMMPDGTMHPGMMGTGMMKPDGMMHPGMMAQPQDAASRPRKTKTKLGSSVLPEGTEQVDGAPCGVTRTTETHGLPSADQTYDKNICTIHVPVPTELKDGRLPSNPPPIIATLPPIYKSVVVGSYD